MMDRIAQAPPAERAELFRRSAAVLRPERSPTIVEKDFWVCWTLRRIYDVLQFRPQLIFKGGTSLSKAYEAIERFSEDVDLSLSRRDLGFTNDRDPEEPGMSGKESRRRIKALVAACKQTIRDEFLEPADEYECGGCVATPVAVAGDRRKGLAPPGQLWYREQVASADFGRLEVFPTPVGSSRNTRL